MTEDDTVSIGIGREHLDEALADPAEALHGNRDVLQERSRPRRPVTGNGRVEALPQLPQCRATRRVPRQLRWHGQGEAVEGLGALGHTPGEDVGLPLLVLDQQSRVFTDVEPGQHRWCPRVLLRDPERRGVHQLDRREPGGNELRQRVRCAVQVVEDDETGSGVRTDRHRAERRLGDERQGSFAADDQMGQDVDRPVEVEERVQPVAHRVLHRELALDLPHRRRVGAQPVPQPEQPAVQLRLDTSQPPLGVDRPGVDRGSIGEHHHRRLQRPVGVELDPARHAARVVGDDATYGAGRLARRIRTEPRAVGGQAGVHGPHRRARLHGNSRSVVEDRDRPEVLAGVHEHVVRAGLTAEAGTSGAEGQRFGEGTTRPQDRRDLITVGGGHHQLRNQQVVRGVVRACQPGRRAVGDPPGRGRLERVEQRRPEPPRRHHRH